MLKLFPIFFLFQFSILHAFAQSEKITESERKLVSAIDTTRINILLELAVLYLRDNSNKADSLANVAYIESRKAKFLNGEIRSIVYLGNIKSYQGDEKAGEEYCLSALHLSDSLKNKKLLSECYNLVYLLLYRKGEYDSATTAAEMSMSFAESSRYKEMLARGNQNLGILNSIKGNHTQAIEHFLQSEKYYTDLENEFALALLLGNMGVTFEEAGNYEKALEYMKKQLVVGDRLNDAFLISNALANVGAVYSQIDLQDSAIHYYERSLRIAEDVKNYDLIILNLDNIGSYYSKKSEYEKASSLLTKAYNLAIDKGFEYQNVYITGHLAQNFLAQRKYDSALHYASLQLNLALDYQFLYDQKLAYENLSKVYSAKKEYRSAYEALLNYIQINDSLFSEEKVSQIEHIREQYETEKKEQEISSLAKEKENVEFKRNIYGILAVLIFIIGVFVYNQQRIRSRRNRLLLEKEKEIDRLKSRFFANISHEFQTPLTLILGPIDDMLAKTENPNDRLRMLTMKRNAERLLELINQLLDLSKIESGKFKINISNSDIIPVIKGITMSFHSIAEQHGIELRTELNTDSLYINFDRPKFESVLTNLLSNAFKFTQDKGKITVTAIVITEQNKKAQNEILRISVEDNGKGIPENEVNQIFDRFYQADNNELLQQEGSGIGLALTKELVELHQGNIYAESKLGKGTKITFELPVFQSESRSEKTSNIDEPVYKTQVDHNVPDLIYESEDETKSELPIVLVIEDNQDVSKYITEILSTSNKVLTATNGQEGIDRALTELPDMIISDVMMPRKDGFEVCNILKNDEKTSHIPIILLTAKSDISDKIKGLTTKADDYLTKPFIPAELLIRVQNLINSRRLLRNKYKQNGVLRPKDIAVNSVDENFLNRFVEIVELHMSNENFGVEELGNKMNMSRSQLHRKLTTTLGQGPNQFIRSFRLQRALELLKQNAATASEVAYRVGFSSPSYFTKCFREQFGYTPSDLPKYLLKNKS